MTKEESKPALLKKGLRPPHPPNLQEYHNNRSKPALLKKGLRLLLPCAL